MTLTHEMKQVKSWKGREAEHSLGKISHIPHRSTAKKKLDNTEKQAEEFSLKTRLQVSLHQSKKGIYGFHSARHWTNSFD
ncbi:hypothetical protein PGIGA_G00200060 [Pangasianodon gigas]|uniref:Uncharacterized protein n=1 Tax=Pangasianodon gigas TaxID=30993 RepID=A0ACC5WDL6_PANGG|nr:hypothetical protein [Pangasianodon gigas]